ncbi:MAG: Gfo/Idh/MocA family protein [Arachnia sp.]
MNALCVGVLGAGPVTQAIHLPSLARLPELFTVSTVMDPDLATAQCVADRVGATATDSLADVVADAAIDVVAVCSPPQFHAAQVIAACRAGKRAVLCEKPFATTREEAAEMARVAEETGVPVVAGAMHTYDPGWLRFAEAWGPLPGSAQHIRLSTVLPPNQRFEDFATEVSRRPDSPGPAGDPAAVLTMGILGLATHDLPIIRRLLSDPSDVVIHQVRLLSPFGYLIVFTSGSHTVELHAHMSGNWAPRWSLELLTQERVGTVDFTPSYVQAGSATSSISTDGQQLSYPPAEDNGYLGEWRHIYRVAHGGPVLYPPAELVADLTFALDLAEAATAALPAHSSDGAP